MAKHIEYEIELLEKRQKAIRKQIERIDAFLSKSRSQSSSELSDPGTDESGREVREDVGPVGFGSGKPMD